MALIIVCLGEEQHIEDNEAGEDIYLQEGDHVGYDVPNDQLKEAIRRIEQTRSTIVAVFEEEITEELLDNIDSDLAEIAKAYCN